MTDDRVLGPTSIFPNGYPASVAVATRLFDSAYDKEVFAQNSTTKELLASYLILSGFIQHLLNASPACASSWLLPTPAKV